MRWNTCNIHLVCPQLSSSTCSRRAPLGISGTGFLWAGCPSCLSTNTAKPQPFTALFPGPPGWAGARRELLDFMVQGKINRGRHTDHPAGRHSIRTSQCPPPPSPQQTLSKYSRKPKPHTHCASEQNNSTRAMLPSNYSHSRNDGHHVLCSICIRVAILGGQKMGSSHTITVCVPGPGAMHSHNGRAEGGRHLLQWGSGPGAPEKKWNCRRKFLLSGTLSSRTLTPAEVQNTTYFHSRLSYMHPAWGNTKNGTGGVPARIMMETGQMGQKTGRPGKNWMGGKP